MATTLQSEIEPLADVPAERRPRHVAIIMDGNGRWAQRQHLPRVEGHRRGVASVRRTVEEAARLKLGQLTLYCLSSENWKRPQRELDFLMHLLEQYMIEERSTIMRQNVVVSHQSPVISRTTTRGLRTGDRGLETGDCGLETSTERSERGFDTNAGERGRMLSGGERQRLSIARALLKDPPILILDEATSALDAVTEAKVNAALDEVMKGRTTFVIAHRLSTIRNATRILVFDSGHVIESGTFDELVAKGGRFAELARAQFMVQDQGRPPKGNPKPDDAKINS